MTTRNAPAQTWSAETLAGIAAKAFGRPVSGRDVRGIVRAGGIVKRLDGRPKGGGNRSHLYTLAEAKAVMTVLAERQSRRTGQSVRLPAPFGPATRSTAPKAPRASVKAVEALSTPESGE